MNEPDCLKQPIVSGTGNSGSNKRLDISISRVVFAILDSSNVFVFAIGNRSFLRIRVLVVCKRPDCKDLSVSTLAPRGR